METLHTRQPNDTVSVHPDVLLTIARAAALRVEGVSRLGVSKPLNRLLTRGLSAEGLHLSLDQETVTLDVFLVVDASHNLRQTSVRVQQEVSRAMAEYVGMTVKAVNVHIEDVIFPLEEL